MRAFQALASAPNTRLVVVPMESTALAGGIVQALQLFRSGDDGPAGSAPPGMPPPPEPPRPLPIAPSLDAAGCHVADRLAVGGRDAGMSVWIIWMVAGLVLMAIEI